MQLVQFSRRIWGEPSMSTLNNTQLGNKSVQKTQKLPVIAPRYSVGQ